MGDGYGVDPRQLQATGKGINDTINELSSLGLSATAKQGDNFGGLSLDGMQLGHAGLTSAMSEFCGRWSWGVRSLVQQGSQFAEQLGLAAGSYHDYEQYLGGVFKDVAGAAIGDPHATDEQTESSSLGDIAARATTSDYSGASFNKAFDDMGNTWSAEGKELINTRVGKINTVVQAVSGGHAPQLPDLK